MAAPVPLASWLRRHRLGLVAAAAALPLLGLVILQYHWMRQLERTSETPETD